MVKLTIDNREVEAREGSTILEAAQRAGIKVPTLCYQSGLSSAGACRVCLVKVKDKPG
ncbi:unnamed protein product, partial [marine sediment metagenome]